MPQDQIWQTPAICEGVNNTLPDIAISDAELSDAANYQPDMTGQGWLIKREGLTKNDANLRTGVTYSIYKGRNSLYTYYHNGTVIYHSGGTALDTGRAAAYDSWTSFGTYDIFVNGTDARKTSNGTTFTDLANVPSGTKYICSSNNFLYAAGHDKGKLRYSSLGLAETWPATNELILTQDENDDIIGLTPVKNGVAVFCTKSFYIISGWSDLDQQVAYYDKSIGAVGNRSIINTPFGLFFWSTPGLVWLKEGYAVELPMQRKLTKTLAGLNREYDFSSHIHGVWDNTQQRVTMWLFNGTSITWNLRMDYYPGRDAFFLHTGAGAAISASAAVKSYYAIESIYCGGYSARYLYSMSGNTDDGVTIDSYFDTKREGNSAIRRTGWNVALTTDLTTTETITYSSYVDNSAAVNYTNSISTATGLVDKIVAASLTNARLKHRVSDSATTRTRILQLTHTGSQNMVR